MITLQDIKNNSEIQELIKYMENTKDIKPQIYNYLLALIAIQIKNNMY